MPKFCANRDIGKHDAMQATDQMAFEPFAYNMSLNALESGLRTQTDQFEIVSTIDATIQ